MTEACVIDRHAAVHRVPEMMEFYITTGQQDDRVARREETMCGRRGRKHYRDK